LNYGTDILDCENSQISEIAPMFFYMIIIYFSMAIWNSPE